eukprot:13113787-Heterocapsa_arctica.AAC.1
MLSARSTSTNPESWHPTTLELGLERRSWFARQHRIPEVEHRLAVGAPMDLLPRSKAIAPDL